MTKTATYYSKVSIHYGIIAFVCFFSFFIHNRVIPADLMESRNLATAQEMVKYGNYLQPTMNGEPRLEKPPLPTWVAAAIEHVTPDNLVAQRCAAGIMAFGMVVFLYLLVSRLTRNRNTGLIAALILATCVNVILMGRTATWDIYTHSFMLGAIYFLVMAWEEKGAQWKYFLLSGLFMGLSFLSKGPVSFYALFLPFLIGYIAVYRPSVKGKTLPLISLFLVCLIVSSGWVLYTLLYHKDVMLSVAEKESSAWLNYNVRPWYYYWKYPVEAGVWALFWVTSLVYFFVVKRVEYRKEYTFAVIWFLASLILLSVIPEKKTRYLLPIMIPGAMMIAFYLYQMITAIRTRGERIVFRINTTAIAVALVVLPVILYFLFYDKQQISLLLLIVITCCTWGLAAYILVCVYGKKEIQAVPVFLSIVLSMMIVSALCLPSIGKAFINDSLISIKHLRYNTNIQGLPFYSNDADGNIRMELVYELNQRIQKLDISDDETIEGLMPFVLLSQSPIDSLMAHKNVNVEPLGRFDNNWRKVEHKRYDPDLVKEVAIIRKKEKR